MKLSEARDLITEDDYEWFWLNHDEDGWRCSRCGGDGFVEYIDSPDLWGEDCPTEENHLLPCPECRQIEIDMIRIILEHKGLLKAG